MRECHVCKALVKPENYARHMQRVHHKTIEEEEKTYPVTKREKKELKKLKRRELKMQIAAEKRKVHIAIGIFVAVIIVIVVIAFGYFYRAPSSGTPAEAVKPVEGKITHLKANVSTGRIHYFIYNDVTYYIHLNPNGNYKTHISECAPCGNKGDDSVPGRGFSLQDNGYTIVCNTCGTSWDTENYLVKKNVGCGDYPPSYLPNTQDETYIYINPEDVRWYQ